MNEFYIGMHHVSDCWPFKRVMVSVNALKDRLSDFRVNDWILDSGAFSQILFHGRFIMTSSQYVAQIARWQRCGRLVAAVAQDWMCEPVILAKTGKSIPEHQDLTVRSYIDLSATASVPILPVLQGFDPLDYVKHLRLYGNLLEQGQWVGVGSVCKRNSNPDAIEDVLLAIKSERPDLQLHGFGLKVTALERATIREMLYSSDSMAWSYAGRREEGKSSSDPRLALKYAARIQHLTSASSFIQEQLYKWWI